jgi:hypothetical protein
MTTRFFSIPFVLAFTSSLSACGYGGGSSPNDPGPDEMVEVPRSTVDTDAVLADIEPGLGVGAFVEYQTGGSWHVFTTCDTETSDFACYFDIVLTPLDGLINFAAEDDLEYDDYVTNYGSTGARFIAYTTYDVDGAVFEAEPGVPLSVDVWLDDAPAEHFIYWVGEGGAHRGAPSNPIELEPSSP